MVEFIIRSIAVYRLTRMLVKEAGPLSMFRKLRIATGVYSDSNGVAYSWPTWNPLHCVYCTSVWVGLLMWLLPSWASRPLALSGLAVLINEASDRWL